MSELFYKILERAVGNITRSMADDYIEANASFRYSAGMRPKIVRRVKSETCKWCDKLAGVYDYEDAPADVYRRHDRCDCDVTYVTEKGATNVHTKKKTAKINLYATGGRIVDPNSLESIEWARGYYKEIQKKSTDYIKIAKRLNIDPEEIKRIKDYLFSGSVWYNPITGIEEEFLPDPAIAQSWQRLAEGKQFLQHDKTLIDHEIYELKIKTENPGISHLEAHDIATRKYNYQKEASDYYANLRKRKKNR